MEREEEMKLTVEIKDGRLIYEYQIGDSKQNSSRPLCAQSFVSFVKLLEVLSQHYEYEDRKWERELVGKAWLEKQEKEK